MKYDLNTLKEKLALINANQLLDHWDSLDSKTRLELAEQIQALDVQTILHQKKLIGASQDKKSSKIFPFNSAQKSGDLKNQTKGQQLLVDGKVGCLIVAGGQGTRLNIDAPKGTYPISNIKHKSLFQLLCEKSLAAGKQTGHVPPLAIMTSPSNHDQTLDFFRKHQNFNLNSEQLYFFNQKTLPFLSQTGSLFLEKPGLIAHGPNGNGTSLADFFQSGIWEKWHRKGIQYLMYVLIDNPLADPFDAELIGHHANTHSDITIKCIERKETNEKVGIIVKEGEEIKVIEYSEFPDEEKIARLPDGTLKYPYANISLFCFSMDFIQKISSKSFSLPLHPCLKPTLHFDREDPVSPIKKDLAWKFETFIFDLLPEAKQVTAVVYPREDCFAPLKNAKGEASPETVQAALLAQDRKILESISQLKISENFFELSQEFHYPTPQIYANWYLRTPPSNSYIEP